MIKRLYLITIFFSFVSFYNNVFGTAENNNGKRTFIPKTIIDSIIVASPADLIELGYNLETKPIKINLILILNDTTLLKTYKLIPKEKCKNNLPINPNFYIINNYHRIKNIKGVIILNKQNNFNDISFSCPKTVKETIIETTDSPDGPCNLSKETTTLNYLLSDSIIEFINYGTTDPRCKLNFQQYDEYQTTSKSAHLITQENKIKTGNIWNSPEGLKGF